MNVPLSVNRMSMERVRKRMQVIKYENNMWFSFQLSTIYSLHFFLYCKKYCAMPIVTDDISIFFYCFMTFVKINRVNFPRTNFDWLKFPFSSIRAQLGAELGRNDKNAIKYWKPLKFHCNTKYCSSI